MIRGAYSISENGYIHGFCFDVNQPSKKLEITLKLDGKTIASTSNLILREHFKNKGEHTTGVCGFVFQERLFSNMDFTPAEKIEVCVDSFGVKLHCANFPAQHFSKFSSEKRMALLHIPKTAGTSLNELFGKYYKSSEMATHVEGNEWLVQKKYHKALKYKFVSGHISYNDFTGICREGLYFKTTMLRNPIAQLKSHIRWVIKITDDVNSGFYKSHQLPFQKVSQKLRDVDFTSESSISKWVSEMQTLEKLLFSNCQTRYLITERNNLNLEQKHFNQASRALEAMHLVGITERVPEYLHEIARIFEWENMDYNLKSNVNSNAKAVKISDSALAEAFSDLLKIDNRLYDFALRNLAP